MIGWFLAVPGRAHFLVCLIGWLSRAQTLYSWYCVLGYTMPLIAAVLVLVTLDKGLSLLLVLLFLYHSLYYTMFYYYDSYYWDSYCSTILRGVVA
jgi:hypothetical protein